MISCCEFTIVAGSALGMQKSAGVCAPLCALERSLFPRSLRPGAGLLLPPCDRSQMWGYPHRGATTNQLQNQTVSCLLLPTAPARPLGGDSPRNGARCRASGLHHVEKAPKCFPSQVLFTRL